MVISFLLVFLLHLIADLDNPFGYGDPESIEDVSIDTMITAQGRIERITAKHFEQFGAP